MVTNFMKTKIEVTTNFSKLDKDCQERIYSVLGCSLAQTYLESLVEPNIDTENQAAKLKINTNNDPYDNNRPENKTQSPQLPSRLNESYRSNNKPINTHLPINEINKSSKPTEGQNKD